MIRHYASLMPLLLGFLLLAGCDQGALTDGPRSDATAAGGAETLTGFLTPESALYDAVADVYYVSNVADPFGGGGFISRISPDAAGDVSGEPGFTWIDGLKSPFGMALDGNTLYVVDRDGLYVYAIDRGTGEATQVDFIAIGGPGSLLNDVCIAEGGPNRGALYVTDTGLDLVTSTGTGTDAIYRIKDGEVSVFVEDAAEEGPNGCMTHGANVYWTTFKSNAIYRTNPSGRRQLLATLPTGGIDSIVRSGGTLYASSWNADPVDPDNPTGVVYAMKPGGQPGSNRAGARVHAG